MKSLDTESKGQFTGSAELGFGTTTTAPQSPGSLSNGPANVGQTSVFVRKFGFKRELLEFALWARVLGKKSLGWDSI